MLDLLLVTPSSRKAVYQSLGDDVAAIEPPVWSGLIATYIRNKGYSVKILDAEAEGLSFQETAHRIANEDPVLTVFVVYGQQPSASTQCMPQARQAALALSLLKPHSAVSVMGTHASAIPGHTMRTEPYDFVIEGEGPYTILRLLEELKGKKNFSEVPGLWWKDGHTLPAPKIQDLDKELPMQAWDLLDMSKYRAHNWHVFGSSENRKPYVSIQTSLGCPFKCSFCCINAPFGGSGIRYWSPENIISQIDIAVQKYGVKNIKFPDEMFFLNQKHVLGICDLIIERGYDLNIWAYARIDTVKKDWLQKMKQAGINWLVLGIESGSKHVRDGVEKGRFNDDAIKRVVREIQDAGINVMGNYIFGLPDDTLESMSATLDLALTLNTEWANFYSAMAYPGSQLYRDAIKNGARLPKDWTGYAQHSYETLPLDTEALTGEQVLSFRDKAHITYFTNPDYISLIDKKFGKTATDAVTEMLSHKLERKHKP